MGRGRWWAIAAVVLVAVVRGLFGVLSIEVFSPIDEAHHHAYVVEVAHGHVPKLREPLPSEVIRLVNRSTEDVPTARIPGDPETYGVYAAQHEAVQGPTYYVLLVPAYWIGRLVGGAGPLYAERFFTVLLAASAIPLAAMAARRLFPRRPSAPVLAAVLLAATQTMSTTLAQVSDDAIVVPLALLLLLAVLRFRERPDPGTGAVLGALAALLLVSKGSTACVLPAAGIAVLAVRPSKRVAAGLLAAVPAGILVLAPWILLSLTRYGDSTPTKAQIDLLRPALQFVDLDGPGIRLQLENLRNVWVFARFLPPTRAYRTVWEVAVVAATAAGIVGGALRRRWSEAGAVAALAGGLVLSAAAAVLVAAELADGLAIPGRYVLPALGPLAVLVAGGIAVAVGDRWAPTLAALVVVAALVLEVPVLDRFHDRWAAQATLDSQAVLAVDQRGDDGYVRIHAVDLAYHCTQGPAVLGILLQPGAVAADLLLDGKPLPTRKLPDPYRGWDVPAGVSSLTLSERVGAYEVPVGAAVEAVPGSAVTSDGIPLTARIWCPVADPTERADLAHDAAFGPLHPVRFSRKTVRSWPRLWVWLALLGAAIAFGVAVRPRPRRPGPSASGNKTAIGSDVS